LASYFQKSYPRIALSFSFFILLAFSTTSFENEPKTEENILEEREALKEKRNSNFSFPDWADKGTSNVKLDYQLYSSFIHLLSLKIKAVSLFTRKGLYILYCALKIPF
jgi:hypothetical protein